MLERERYPNKVLKGAFHVTRNINYSSYPSERTPKYRSVFSKLLDLDTFLIPLQRLNLMELRATMRYLKDEKIVKHTITERSQCIKPRNSTPVCPAGQLLPLGVIRPSSVSHKTNKHKPVSDKPAVFVFYFSTACLTSILVPDSLGF